MASQILLRSKMMKGEHAREHAPRGAAAEERAERAERQAVFDVIIEPAAGRVERFEAMRMHPFREWAAFLNILKLAAFDVAGVSRPPAQAPTRRARR